MLTAADPILPRFAAADLADAAGRPVKVLAGDNAAWRDAGYPTEGRATVLRDAVEDVWLSPYYQEDRSAAFQRYRDWEIALPDQIARDETVSFQRYAEAA